MGSPTQNPWIRQNLDGPPPLHELGLWLNYRKQISAGYVPSRKDRARLRDGRWHGMVIPWQVGPQQTLEFQGSSPGNFAVMALAGNIDLQPDATTQTGSPAKIAKPNAIGYQAQIYDPVRKRQLTDQPVNFGNLVGTGLKLFILKKPYVFEPKTPVLVILSNLATIPNSGRIVLYGKILFGDVSDIGAPVPGNDPETGGPDYAPVQKPPWNERPAAGESFSPAATVALPAVGATSTIVQFTVPKGRSGVIDRIANQLLAGGGWVDGNGDLVWQIVINGVPVKNYEAIVAQLGLVQAPSEIAPIRLRENDVVKLTVTNVALGVVGGQLIGGRLGGWYYPKELDPVNLW